MECADRRTVIAMIGGFALTSGLGPVSAALSPSGGFVMWHSPGCGCCLEWGRRIEAAFGRKLPILEVADMAAVKRAQNVPADLQSCHTARIGNYVVEGHVPPADIKRLIASKSRIVRGLAVPGMPLGSPGMEAGRNREAYKVIAFGAGGRRSTFASHH